jgi:hypothetical protein
LLRSGGCHADEARVREGSTGGVCGRGGSRTDKNEEGVGGGLARVGGRTAMTPATMAAEWATRRWGLAAPCSARVGERREQGVRKEGLTSGSRREI